ncbi:MAG: class I SAM-dependent methyltransferase [Bacteroidota bacterium]
MSHTEAVKHFYDHNTAAFLRWGKHKQTFNIHQPLWAEGVNTFEEAVSYSNQLVLREVESLAISTASQNVQIIDLGCGVGSSALYLADKLQIPAQIWGITISPEQVRLAQEFAAKQASKARCQFLEGDFLQWPAEIPKVDLAFAIEAFLHTASPERFFEAAAQGLKTGGKLVLIDDFLSPRAERSKLSQKQHQQLSSFRQGWMAGSLLSQAGAESIAQKRGFRLLSSRNLSPFMQLGRPRDKVIGLMVALAGKWMQKSTYFKMMHGGYAKQQSLKQDLLRYQMLVWERE